MKLGVLFSGGKDSALALMKAKQHESVVCLITLVSENNESYMFHTPNISVTSLQAKAIGLPLIKVMTKGEKERELIDLEKALVLAKKTHGIEGVVTGAIESVYQAERIQKVCSKLKLWCFNPLWKKDQEGLLNELIENGFDVMVCGIFADPLTEDFLGRRIDKSFIKEMLIMRDQHKISLSGEGGEIETTVLNAPFFKKKIVIIRSSKESDNHSGIFLIKEARLAPK